MMEQANINTPSRIDVTNINEKVYNYIKENIINSNFPSGYKINFKQLIEDLGVSQTPIKDALFRLAGEGLIDIQARTGTYVRSITETDIHEIIQARVFLETSAVGEIISIITDQDLQTLREIYKKSVSLSLKPNDTESYKMFMEYDSQFHFCFFRILGNKNLFNMYRNLNAHMQIVRFRLINHTQGILPRTNELHRAILDALYERNAEKAKQAIIDHMVQLKQDVTSISQR